MMSAIRNFFQSAVNRISARTRIVVGQMLLLVGVMLMAMTVGLFPNQRRATLAGRSKLCESAAVYCSSAVARGDADKIGPILEPMLRRDEDVLAAAVRREDGSILTRFGDDPFSADPKARPSMDSDIYVPIYSQSNKWGSLEIRFKPLTPPGFRAYLMDQQLQLIAFVSVGCLLLYSFYLRKMLQHLDPSKVVPPRVRSALDTLAEGLIVLDNDERIVLANQAFAEIVGKACDELMGVRVSSLPWQTVSEPALLPRTPWSTVIEGGTPARGVMMRLRDRQGALRTFSVNCSPVLGSEGKSRGVLISLDDVTKLEQNEAELRKSKDEAESANRAKSDFLARMSHEIRTPMNAILGFADILRRGYEENESERQEYLETIHNSGQHLLELINDILDLSKIEAGKLEFEMSRCSPNSLISQVIAVLSVRAKQKGIGLSFEWSGTVPDTIETDPTRVRQALTNLVGNAIKFTESGQVRVVARVLPGRDPQLAVAVGDSGIGMKPDVLNRIFTPFSQADTSITRRFGGTGLGLSISKQIAEALGGRIEVASEFGKGSTFTLVIGTGSLEGVAMLESASMELTAAVPTSPDNIAAYRLDGVRVLLAEDGTSNRKLISLVLERLGAVIDSAEDGQAAVELASKNSYDLILMDMQMPVMDGYTAATILRRKGATLPIIALTAHAMRGDEEKCRAAGCSGFLTKPIDMDLLVRTVAEAAGVRDGATPTAAETKSPQAALNAAPAPSTAATNSPRPLAGGTLQSTLPTEDPEFCQIVEEFVDRLGQQIGAISKAWSEGDLDELARLAHWVKGSGGTAGFAMLTDPARELEQAAHLKRLDDIGAAISHLQDLTSRIAAPPRSESTSSPSRSMSLEAADRPAPV
jgi:PAS domain S-box-containing protein